MTQDINGATRLICLFGDPVAHSKSPHLHNRAFERAGLNYAYMAFRVPGEDMKQATDAIRLLNMRGCNLTMPNKIAVIPFLDKLDPIAEMVGAVNTIVNEDGVLTGYSTDGYGFMKSFEEHGVDAKGKKMVLMGMGGAGTPIAAQAALDGVGEIVVFSPSTGKSWDRVAEEVALVAEKTGCKISRRAVPHPRCIVPASRPGNPRRYLPASRNRATENGQRSRLHHHQRRRNAVLPGCPRL